MNDAPETPDHESGSDTSIGILNDTIGDIITGIPASIRKNAVRAFTRLCTAAIEYPVALIEGAIAEKRAEAQARVKIINASADQIAAEVRTPPEYAQAAARKFAQKIVRERVNVDNTNLHWA